MWLIRTRAGLLLRYVACKINSSLSSARQTGQPTLIDSERTRQKRAIRTYESTEVTLSDCFQMHTPVWFAIQPQLYYILQTCDSNRKATLTCASNQWSVLTNNTAVSTVGDTTRDNTPPGPIFKARSHSPQQHQKSATSVHKKKGRRLKRPSRREPCSRTCSSVLPSYLLPSNLTAFETFQGGCYLVSCHLRKTIHVSRKHPTPTKTLSCGRSLYYNIMDERRTCVWTPELHPKIVCPSRITI